MYIPLFPFVTMPYRNKKENNLNEKKELTQFYSKLSVKIFLFKGKRNIVSSIILLKNNTIYLMSNFILILLFCVIIFSLTMFFLYRIYNIASITGIIFSYILFYNHTFLQDYYLLKKILNIV